MKGHIARNCRTSLPGDRKMREKGEEESKKSGKDKKQGKEKACAAAVQETPDEEWTSDEEDME